MKRAKEAREALAQYADDTYAASHQRLFKSGTGEYAEGDTFIGARMPNIRTVAKEFRELPLKETEKLLHSKIHEERMLALVILAEKFPRYAEPDKKRVYDLYLANTTYVNNWDLVDASAHKIVGAYLWEHPEKTAVLKKLARSDDIWERRIAMVATAFFIGKAELAHTFRIAKMLLQDEHDLIHKAAGWMLREAGKKDSAALRAFLDEHGTAMPRTMVRYAIERFPERERKKYLRSTSQDV